MVTVGSTSNESVVLRLFLVSFVYLQKEGIERKIKWMHYIQCRLGTANCYNKYYIIMMMTGTNGNNYDGHDNGDNGNTVNSLYNQHLQDHDLVSVIEKICSSEQELFSVTLIRGVFNSTVITGCA